MKAEVEECVRKSKLVAIIRGFDTETTLKLVDAYVKGGIRVVEVTYVQTDRSLWKRTSDSIRAISTNFGKDLCVGAGTVLTSEQLQMTQDAGGMFMVAPNVNAALIRACVGKDMAAIPGAMTPTEAVAAWEAGASFVKVFPAGVLGPAYVKAIMTPLAHIPMLAVGGITADNIAEFMKIGCVGAAVSGMLQNKALMAAGKWNEITAIAKTLVERVGA